MRCPKCDGLLYTDRGFIKCFNCGKWFFQKDPLLSLYTHLCIKCGEEFVTSLKTKKVCGECMFKSRKDLEARTCVKCGEKFKSFNKKTRICKVCAREEKCQTKGKKSYKTSKTWQEE